MNNNWRNEIVYLISFLYLFANFKLFIKNVDQTIRLIYKSEFYVV